MSTYDGNREQGTAGDGPTRKTAFADGCSTFDGPRLLEGACFAAHDNGSGIGGGGSGGTVSVIVGVAVGVLAVCMFAVVVIAVVVVVTIIVVALLVAVVVCLLFISFYCCGRFGCPLIILK